MATISLVYYTTWRRHLSPISFLYLPWAEHGESVNYTRLAPCTVSSVTYGSVHCFFTSHDVLFLNTRNTYVTYLLCIIVIQKRVIRLIHGVNRWDHKLLDLQLSHSNIE